MAFRYKPNQGKYTRNGALAAVMLLAVLAAVRLFDMIQVEEAFRFLGLDVQYGYIWAGLLFVLLSAIGGVFAWGVKTGIGGIDAKSRALSDLLIDTQVELQKVSWPGREELTNATVVVLVCIILLGIYLFFVDLLFSQGMQMIHVLPKPR